MTQTESQTWWCSLETDYKNKLIDMLYTVNVNISNEVHETVAIDPVDSHEYRQLELMCSKLQNTLEDKNKIIDKILFSPLQCLKQQLDVIQNQTQLIQTQKTNVQLGSEGEHLVDELLHDNVAYESLTDTSKMKSNGDRLLIVSGEHIILEVKNVSQTSLTGSRKKYTEQIIEDVTLCSGLVVGILVSTRDTYFKNKDRIQVEFVDTETKKICIIFCAGISEYPFLMSSAVQIAVAVSKLLKTNPELTDKIHNITNIVNTMLKQLRQDTTLIEKLKKSNTSHISQINAITSLLV